MAGLPQALDESEEVLGVGGIVRVPAQMLQESDCGGAHTGIGAVESVERSIVPSAPTPTWRAANGAAQGAEAYLTRSRPEGHNPRHRVGAMPTTAGRRGRASHEWSYCQIELLAERIT